MAANLLKSRGWDAGAKRCIEKNNSRKVVQDFIFYKSLAVPTGTFQAISGREVTKEPAKIVSEGGGREEGEGE